MTRILAMTVLVVMLGTSCTTTQTAPSSSSAAREWRPARTKRTYRKQVLEEVLQRADDTIQAGIRYYNSGHFQDALVEFIEAYRIIERFDATLPVVQGRLNRIKGYFGQIHDKNKTVVLRHVRALIDQGTKVLNVQMLESAEMVLESLKRWQPGLGNEVDALLIQLRDAKRRVKRELRRGGYS